MTFQYEIDELVFNRKGETLKIVDREATMDTVDSKGAVHPGVNLYAAVIDHGHYADHGGIVSYYEEELSGFHSFEKPEIQPQEDPFIAVMGAIGWTFFYIGIISVLMMTAGVIVDFIHQVIAHYV